MKINLNAPINVTSYGYVSYNILKQLKKLNHDVKHIPISQNSPDDEMLSNIKDVINKWDYHHFAPCIKIWHQHNLGAFYGKGMRIGMPIFELEQFNEMELHNLKNPDRLYVCSKWAESVIKRQVKEQENNVKVIPLGVDRDIFKECELPTVDKTIFGNFGKFETRKGHDVLPEIFNKAFEKDDDVLLVMMPHNFFLNKNETEEWIKKFKNTKIGDKIVFVGRQNSQSMVYNIMSQIHCGIFPSRAEGWNLEALELLSCGRHVIITNCTGHIEFCNKNNSLLIDMKSGYEPAKDIKFFDGRFNWKKFGKDEIYQTVEHLRSIHKKRKEGKLSLNKNGIKTSKIFSWENTAKTIVEDIECFL